MNRPFDLEREPAFRAVLYRIGECSQLLQMTLHHASSDGWSTGIFFAISLRCTVRLPEAPLLTFPSCPSPSLTLRAGSGSSLPGLKANASSSIGKTSCRAVHSRFNCHRPASAGASDFQRSLPALYAAGCTRESDQKSLHARASHAVYGADGCARCGDGPLLRSIRHLDWFRDCGALRVETEGLVGFFTNTIILRARLEPELTFRGLLRQVRDTALGAYAHQELPLQLIIDKIGAERDPSRPALFQVMLILQNTAKRKFDFHGLETRVQRSFATKNRSSICSSKCSCGRVA